MTTLRLLAWYAVCTVGVARAGASSVVARVRELEVMNEVLMATNHELMDVIIPGLRKELKALREYVGAVDRGSFEKPVPSKQGADGGHDSVGSVDSRSFAQPVPSTQGADGGQDSFGSVDSRSFAQPVPSTQGADARHDSSDVVRRRLSGGSSRTAKMMYDGAALSVSTDMNVSGTLYATTVVESRDPPSGFFTSETSTNANFAQNEVLSCEKIVYDTDNAYDSATYKYTVPVSGIYLLYAQLFVNDLPSDNTQGRAGFFLNDAMIVNSGTYMSSAENVVLTYPLTKGDIIYMGAAGADGLTNVGMWIGHTYWGLHMVSQSDSVSIQ